jgi:hypothetical protein
VCCLYKHVIEVLPSRFSLKMKLACGKVILCITVGDNCGFLKKSKMSQINYFRSILARCVLPKRSHMTAKAYVSEERLQDVVNDLREDQNRKFETITKILLTMQARMDERFQQMDDRFQQMDESFQQMKAIQLQNTHDIKELKDLAQIHSSMLKEMSAGLGKF